MLHTGSDAEPRSGGVKGPALNSLGCRNEDASPVVDDNEMRKRLEVV